MMYRVAERLGYKSIDDLVESLPRQELEEWLALCWIDGWGEDYLRSAIIAKQIADIMSAFGSGQPIPIQEFMPRQARPRHKTKPKSCQSTPLDQWMRSMIARRVVRHG